MAKKDEFSEKMALAIVEQVERLIDKKLEGLESANAQKPLMNKKEAASYIGVSINTLNKFVEEGLPVIDVGGVKLISTKDVWEFLDKHKKK